MHLSRLVLRDFRNISEAVIDPHARFNVLAGPNGAGKSNVLEAIYMLANVRSFRPGRNKDLTRIGAARCSVEASVHNNITRHAVRLEIDQRRKRFVVDEKNINSFATYLGTVSAVAFTPSDLNLLRGGATERRRFLDRIVSGSRAAHLGDLVDYETALKARNHLLKDQRVDSVLLAAYSEQLIPLAARIIARRLKVIDQLRPIFRAVFGAIFSPDFTVDCRYHCRWKRDDALLLPNDSEALTKLVESTLVETSSAERRAGHTLVGPHRDDLAVTLNGMPTREYASQGQTRATVLALKITEIRFLEAARGECPILLLDDVSSELDARRNEQLFDFIRDIESQTFISTTDRNYIRIQEHLTCFDVKDGQITLAP